LPLPAILATFAAFPFAFAFVRFAPLDRLGLAMCGAAYWARLAISRGGRMIAEA